ncbi:MAG: xanthine dehydrogenase accessory factor [Candidatus Cloacimonadota bacterium]|nr:xanthine dehydrogenase accessory factor [Candidatus Cloacimonadota bacterium]
MIEKQIAEAILAQKKFVKVIVVEKTGSGPAEVGTTMLAYPGGKFKGTVGGGTLEKLAQLQAEQVLKNEKSILKAYNLDENDQVTEQEVATNMACGGKVKLFYEIFLPNQKFYIFGAGHIGKKLLEMLKLMDLEAEIIDVRAELLKNIPNGVQVQSYDDFFVNYKIPAGSYVVVATHSHELDYTILKNIMLNTSKLKYIGLVASKQKTASMLEKLETELDELPELSSLYMPVGLNIGGSMPAEIALAILAEIQTIRYQKSEIKHLRRIER